MGPEGQGKPRGRFSVPWQGLARFRDRQGPGQRSGWQGWVWEGLGGPAEGAASVLELGDPEGGGALPWSLREKLD